MTGLSHFILKCLQCSRTGSSTWIFACSYPAPAPIRVMNEVLDFWFALTQSWSLQAFDERTNRWNLSFSLFLSLPVSFKCNENKCIKRKKIKYWWDLEYFSTSYTCPFPCLERIVLTYLFSHILQVCIKIQVGCEVPSSISSHSHLLPHHWFVMVFFLTFFSTITDFSEHILTVYIFPLSFNCKLFRHCSWRNQDRSLSCLCSA